MKKVNIMCRIEFINAHYIGYGMPIPFYDGPFVDVIKMLYDDLEKETRR